eukprot:gene11613-24313_t
MALSYFTCLVFMVSLSMTSSSNRNSYQERNQLFDPATSLYFQLVYNVNSNVTTSISTNNIQMTYANQEVDIISPRNHVFKYRCHFKATGFTSPSTFYKSYEWAEVIRLSSECLQPPGRENCSDEGYSSGWEMKGPKIAYGCWFLRLSGSGIFVNVGKTIVSRTREELMRKLNIKQCVDDPSPYCPEKEFCTKAIEKGYDSIQLDIHPASKIIETELIICSGQCSTVTFNTSCPPGVELRTGLGASRPCTCDDSLPIINCSNKKSQEHKHCRTSPVSYNKIKRRKSCFLLGGKITDNPISTNISIFYIRNESDTQYIQSRLSDLFSSTNSTATTTTPVFLVLTTKPITLWRHIVNEYSMREYHSARDIPIQNTYVKVHKGHNILSLSPSYSRALAISGEVVYNKLNGLPCSVISMSGADSNDRLLIRLDHDIINHIIDESVCMRRSGVSIVILMVYGRIDRGSYHTLSHHLKGYVDVILEDENHQNHDSISGTSEGEHLYQIHLKDMKKGEKQYEDAVLPPIVPILENRIVHLMWNSQGSLTFLHI